MNEVNKKSRVSANNLVKKIIGEFERGINLIESLDDECFTKTTCGVGSIGSHFRHNLDFANGFLNGLNTGRIDYNNRERNVKVEQQRVYAKEQFRFIIQKFKNLGGENFRSEIHIRSEIDENEWHSSSVSRELEFLHSHTVHHFALVAEKLHSFGIELPSDFGVAPSTLKYWSELKQNSKVA